MSRSMDQRMVHIFLTNVDNPMDSLSMPAAWNEGLFSILAHHSPNLGLHQDRQRKKLGEIDLGTFSNDWDTRNSK